VNPRIGHTTTAATGTTGTTGNTGTPGATGNRRAAARGSVLLWGTVLLLGALLCACKVGPNYHGPTPPAGADAPLVSLDAAAETTAPPPDDWWQLYHDARLDAFIQEAFDANRQLAAAEANFSAATAVVSAARAGLYPSTTASFGGIYGRDATTDEILELQGQAPQTLWLFEDLFEVGYEVDLFGKVRRSIEAAHANAQAAQAARDALKVVVAAETARAFAQVCTLGEQLAVARHSHEVVAHEADITRNRHDAGAASDYEVARAQALEAQARSAIAPLEGQRRAALFQLTAVLGRTPANAPHELEDCVTPPILNALIPIGDGATLIRRRPDVRQAERRLAAATAQIGVATADLYPSIKLVGLYGGAATETSLLTSNLGLTWGVGPAISWNFPNQAGPRARIRQAKANTAGALAAFDSVVLDALKETEQALTLYASALDYRQALADSQSRIHDAFRMAHDQFLAGAVSNLDLLTTEQSLIAADAAVAASDGALVQDQIAVFKALGGGWQTAAHHDGQGARP
jgi:NodT family efflux transporter outer membrane factor (OMF) lipoprotein